MATAQDVFERYFAGLTPDEVDAQLGAVPQPGANPLTVDARAYLAAHGGAEAATVLADYDPQKVHQDRTLVAAQTLGDTLRCSVDIDEAARLLGVSRSRISHRLAAGTLYAFTLQHRRRIPRWQITEDGSPIPGLGEIVTAIPVGVHPLALHSFMTLDQPEFDGLSPVQYLASGGSAQIVAAWIADLGR